MLTLFSRLWCQPAGCAYLRVLTSVPLKTLEKAPGTIFHPHVNPVESITTKTLFVFVNCTSMVNHEKAERGPSDASFLPQTVGSSLVTSTLSNIVVRSKTVSCVGLWFDIRCPKRSPLPFSHVTSHSHTLTLSSSAPSSAEPHDLCGQSHHKLKN